MIHFRSYAASTSYPSDIHPVIPADKTRTSLNPIPFTFLAALGAFLHMGLEQ
jgi:hypothetical protein